MTDEALTQIPETQVFEQFLLNIISEALELRHGEADDPEGRLPVADPNDGPDAVMAVLLRVRQRSDRVDYLLGQVTRAKARARRSRDAAKYEAELAYNTATSTNEANRTREFVTKEERHAAAALDSLAEKRAAFLADRNVSVADEAYDVVQQVHRQFENMRNDLRAMVRNFQFESSLER